MLISQAVKHQQPQKASAGLLSNGLSSATYVLLAALSCASVNAQTLPVAEVEYVRGIAFVQQANASPRIMGKGSKLDEGDKISTSEGSLAIMKLQDGTRMTVRPSTELVLTQFKYDAKATDNSMVLNLLRGGLRAITGLVNKNGSGTARIQTNTATIGIAVLILMPAYAVRIVRPKVPELLMLLGLTPFWPAQSCRPCAGSWMS